MSLPKGRTNNPNGRPKGGNAFVEQLREALDKVAKAKGKTLIQHAVEQSYVDNVVMIALLKKLLPDQIGLSNADGSPLSIQIVKYDK